jgi:hypothetical protein
VPEGDRWQQYLREWRRLSPEDRRAAILELSAEDREAFRAVLANRRSGPHAAAAGATSTVPASAGPGEARSRLPLLLGLLACALLALVLVRGWPRGPEPASPSARPDQPGTASPSSDWPRWFPGRAAATAPPGVLELVDLVRSAAGGSWHTNDGPWSPIRWSTAQPLYGGDHFYRNGEVQVAVNGGLATTGRVRMPWDVVLTGPTLDHANRILLEQRGPSNDLAGFQLWSYLQAKGWAVLRETRCPFDANPETWLHLSFGKPFWLEDASICDPTSCRVIVRVYLDDEADAVACEFRAGRGRNR